MKFCVDCKHYRYDRRWGPRWWDFGWMYLPQEWRTPHQCVREADLVTGDGVRRPCSLLRLDYSQERACGTEARWFEPKEASAS